jgi:hypothetical protein
VWDAGVDALAVYDGAVVRSAVHSAGADDVVAVVVVELEDDFD